MSVEAPVNPEWKCACMSVPVFSLMPGSTPVPNFGLIYRAMTGPTSHQPPLRSCRSRAFAHRTCPALVSPKLPEPHGSSVTGRPRSAWPRWRQPGPGCKARYSDRSSRRRCRRSPSGDCTTGWWQATIHPSVQYYQDRNRSRSGVCLSASTVKAVAASRNCCHVQAFAGSLLGGSTPSCAKRSALS